ncbi:hypothetical protein [Bacteroides caecigallinarum]|uniref:hypothetical protein n=1 Tax=Bacteroides caecigallinarum TaxID=1411144 RepID=UPI001F4819BB|nr:hypothetical protein [Bacteroides caecigallinarum]MCF2552379.1 hypothetical protein [Bacteroides caecigallinarum]
MLNGAGRGESGLKLCGVPDWACPDIADYNFSASLPKLWALQRGLWLCPKNPARAFTPMQPDQRVTLSLETPLSGLDP